MGYFWKEMSSYHEIFTLGEGTSGLMYQLLHKVNLKRAFTSLHDGNIQIYENHPCNEYDMETFQKMWGSKLLD